MAAHLSEEKLDDALAAAAEVTTEVDQDAEEGPEDDELVMAAFKEARQRLRDSNK